MCFVVKKKGRITTKVTKDHEGLKEEEMNLRFLRALRVLRGEIKG